MTCLKKGFPEASDYFGTVWTLLGINDGIILEHGSTGTLSYHVMNFRRMDAIDLKKKYFSSGLNEADLVFGQEDKLIEAICEIDNDYEPKLIALVATGISQTMGMDLDGIVKEGQGMIKSPMLAFTGGGFAGHYRNGIEMALCQLVSSLVKEPVGRQKKQVNIIGMTMADYNYRSDLSEIRRLLSLLDVRVHAVLCQDTDVNTIETMAESALNLVVHDTGQKAARYLQQHFDMPYLQSSPFGIQGTVQWLEMVGTQLGITVNPGVIAREIRQYGKILSDFCTMLTPYQNLHVGISGSSVYVLGLTRILKKEGGMPVDLAVVKYDPDFSETEGLLKAWGVRTILQDPSEDCLSKAINAHRPQIFFGDSNDLEIAEQVHVKIHSDFPCYDQFQFYDQTPFMGFRGNACLLQTLLNAVSRHPEVWGL